jgi:small ligand-binding sensory domain FIST
VKRSESSPTERSASPRFAAALSTEGDCARAEEQIVESLRADLGGSSADLVCVFVSHHYGDALEHLGPRLASALSAKALVGCSGETIIGAVREVEEGPALSVWAAHLPGTQVRPFGAQFEMDEEGHGRFTGILE